MSRFVRLALTSQLLLAGCSFTSDFGSFKFEPSDPGKQDGGPRPGSDGGGDGDGDGPGSDAGKEDAGPPPDPICETAQMEGGGCDPVAICNSATGKPVCTCPDGYFDVNGDGSECVDLDECRGGAFMCDAEATCLNTAGAYECLCNPGYVMNKSTNECLDSCLVLLSTPGKCAAEALCTKPEGAPVCRCPSGYMDPNGDGSVCTPDEKCMALGCDPNAMCNGADDMPKCECIDGFTGDGKTCSDVDECMLGTHDCGPNAFCTNAPGGFICTCNEGSTGDGKTCTDVNECADNTDLCSSFATCTNKVGAEKYSCKCNDGYSGDGLTCTDVDECALGQTTCAEAAECNNTPGSYECRCKTGYRGDGKTCTDIDECTENTDDCAASEKCVNTPGKFTCGCDAGYEKNGSGVCVDVNECTSGQATCNTSTEVCNNTAGSYNCGCKPGYALRNGTCQDVDECAANSDDCHANATCENKPGTFACACNTGYSGNGKSCMDIDECASSTTHNCDTTRATCSNDPGTFHCTCKTGYLDGGANSSDGLGCTDIDECLTNNGSCGSALAWTCTNNQGAAPTCTDINECTTNTDLCDDLPVATCTNSVGNYTCSCPAGYTINGDGKSQTGCCTPDGSTESAKPNDGKDNDCNGSIDLAQVDATTTFPEVGGAAVLSHVSIAVVTPAITGATLKCRHYKRAAGASGSFVTCANPITRVDHAAAKLAANNGAWRTEFYWEYPSGARSGSASYDYYVHNSIGGLAYMSSAASTTPTPKCTLVTRANDDAIFTEAAKSLNAGLVGRNSANTQLVDPGPFVTGVNNTFLTSPFITVEYKPLTGGYFSLLKTIAVSLKEATPTSVETYKAEMLSLRHRFVLSSDKRYILIRRVYPSRQAYDYDSNGKGQDCNAIHMTYANTHWARDVAGNSVSPVFHKLTCHAVVVNRAGAGVCINMVAGVPQVVEQSKQNYAPAAIFGYGSSNKYMWRHLLDEDDWGGSITGTANRTGFRNFSEKCDTTNCVSNSYELFLPDKATVKQ